MINSVGNSATESFSNILNGISGVSHITHFDASRDSVQIAAEVKDFNPLEVLDKKEVKKCDRFVHLGLFAAKEALEDAKIDLDRLDNNRIGVSGATGIGGLPSIQVNIEKNFQQEKDMLIKPNCSLKRFQKTKKNLIIKNKPLMK